MISFEWSREMQCGELKKIDKKKTYMEFIERASHLRDV